MSVVETLRDGRFVLLGTLGQGAQGRTLDAFDRRDGVAVAIKRFDVRSARTWKEAELAEREVRVLHSLTHPRLPKYIDHFEEDGALYLVMGKIEGETLASLRHRGVRFSSSDVVRFLADARDALDYLHGLTPPVVHRDLKPGNVLRRPDGSFAFVDFGAVRDTVRREGGSTVVGTFGYMAPEQFQGRALPASDIYAVGATALAMLTGSEPETLPHRGLAIDVRAALGGGASPRLVRVLERMLTPDPERRASRLSPLLVELDSQAELKPGRPRRSKSPGLEGRWRTSRLAARSEVAEAWRSRGRVLSPPLATFLRLGLAIGILHVLFATQVLVPLFLYVLSIFVASPGLRRAPARVSAAGRHAVVRMARFQRWIDAHRRAGQTSASTRTRWPTESAQEARTTDPVRIEQDEPFEEEPEHAARRPRRR